jgi:hypothetical protein
MASLAMWSLYTIPNMHKSYYTDTTILILQAFREV